MATDAQSLLTEANCFACFATNIYTESLLELALLRQISLAGNPANDVSAQGLIAAANCYECFSANNNMENLLELGLLKQIAEA
jgi:hypothetical protein